MIFDFILKPTISFALLGQIISVDFLEKSVPSWGGTQNVLIEGSGKITFDYVAPYKEAAFSSKVNLTFPGLYALFFVANSEAFEWIVGGNEIRIIQYDKNENKVWEDCFSFRNVFGGRDTDAYCHFVLKPESSKISVLFLMKNLQSDLEIKDIRLYMLEAGVGGDN